MLNRRRVITALAAVAALCGPVFAQFSGIGSYGTGGTNFGSQRQVDSLLSKLTDQEKEIVFSLVRQSEELQQAVTAQQARLKKLDEELTRCKTTKP